jgi:uncharacterized Zn finger protein (UPF0148 family)
MFESCESCGGRLHCYEGEVYCPDCTRWEVVRLADEEVRVLRLLPAPPWEEWPSDGPPW